MSELVTKSVAQEQQKKIETRTAVERIVGFFIVATAVGVLAVLVATALYGGQTGQVLAEIAGRNRVLRLQGIRGLGRRLFCSHRRKCSR